MRRTITLLVFAMGLGTASLMGQSSKYPPLSEYMMEPDAEIVLAKSAAPEKISEHATVKVLTATGYKVVSEGNNGFVCIVMRGWSAPTFTPVKDRELVYYSKLRAPICFDPVASRTVLPYQELRTKLGLEGKGLFDRLAGNRSGLGQRPYQPGQVLPVYCLPCHGTAKVAAPYLRVYASQTADTDSQHAADGRYRPGSGIIPGPRQSCGAG